MRLYYKELDYLKRFLSVKRNNDKRLNRKESNMNKVSTRTLKEIERKYHIKKKDLINEYESQLKSIDLSYIALYDNSDTNAECVLYYEGLKSFFKVRPLKEIEEYYQESYIKGLLTTPFSEAHEMSNYIDVMLDSSDSPLLLEEKKLFVSLYKSIEYGDLSSDITVEDINKVKHLSDIAKQRDKQLLSLYDKNRKEVSDYQKLLSKRQDELYSHHADNFVLNKTKEKLLSMVKDNPDIYQIFKAILNEFVSDDIELFISLCKKKELLVKEEIKNVFDEVTYSYYVA